MKKEPIAAGKSSFNLIDPGKFFSELSLLKESAVLDLACGSGAYTIALAEKLSGRGRIYAVDLWEQGIDILRAEAKARNIANIFPSVADVSKSIPAGNNSIDLCLMATVLHDLVEDKTEKGTLQEVKRVLKQSGILAIIEFKKIQGPPGPPVHIRLAPQELISILSPYGFNLVRSADLGAYNYLSLFRA